MALVRPAIALLAISLGSLCACGDPGEPMLDRSAPERSATSTTTPAESTVAPDPSTTSADDSDLPRTVETPVGTWTRVPGSATGLHQVPAPTSTPGPPAGDGSTWPAYELDGQVVALGTLDQDAHLNDDVHLSVWHLHGPGTWTVTGTGPPMPAYRMRWSAELSIEPILRAHDILLLDAAGNFVSVTPDGAIASAGLPHPPGLDAVGPTDRIQNVAATDHAVLVTGIGPDLALWRAGWDAWRTARLPFPPSDTPGAPEGPVQAWTVNDQFFVNVVANRSMTTWKLTRPA